MKITEIFHSIQGEGLLAGFPSVFVRIAGCPLRCTWCDTKYAWDRNGGKDCSVEEITGQMEKLGARHVVITGGEPMIESQLPKLAEAIAALGRHITIETAGIEFVPDLACDLMSISPKLSNSAPAGPSLPVGRLNPEMLRRLVAAYPYQLKFVVDSPDDLLEVREILDIIGPLDPDRVMLMPQASDRARYLSSAPMVAGLCLDHGFVFSSRLQVLLWDGARGA